MNLQQELEAVIPGRVWKISKGVDRPSGEGPPAEIFYASAGTALRVSYQTAIKVWHVMNVPRTKIAEGPDLQTTYNKYLNETHPSVPNIPSS